MKLNESSLLALLDDVSAFEQEHELGESFNFFEAVGMARQEIRHSRFLAFMLNPSAAHGLGEVFLRAFLDHVMKQSDSPVMSRLDVMLSDLGAAEVYSERDHFDITIWLPEQKLLMVIENKIGSSESSGQLSKYRERVKRRYPEETFCGVFLTAEGYDGEDSNWTAVGYTEIYGQLKVLLSDPLVSVNTDIYLAIKHYLYLIRKHIVVDEKLIKACRSIYVKHRTALNLIIEHGQFSLVREAAERFLIDTPYLSQVAGSNNYRINIVGNTWKDITTFQVANTSRWMCEYPLVLWFNVDDKKSTPMLSIILEVGPVRENAQFDREALILKLRDEFKVTRNSKISKTYTRIKRYNKSGVDLDNIDCIVDAMKILWKDFGGIEKLKRIDSIVQDVY